MNSTETDVQTPVENIVPEARRAYSRSLLNIAIYWALAVVAKMLIGMLLPKDASQTIKYLSSFIPMYLFAFPLYLLISKPLPTAKPETHSMTLPQIILAFFACECLAIGGNFVGIIVNVILSMLLKFSTQSTFLFEGVFGDSSLVFLFAAVLVAPVVEEMIFRKTLIDRVRKYGDKTAILLSGLMFGMFHGNFSQFFYAAGVGLLFAWIYVRTGKIQHTIILHVLLNFWGSAMPLLMLRNALQTAWRSSGLSPDRREDPWCRYSLRPRFSTDPRAWLSSSRARLPILPSLCRARISRRPCFPR